MVLTKDLVNDIVEWDVENWKHALFYWDKHLPKNGKSLNCLELGGRKGGCSLWLAKSGHSVVCSDITNPQDEASILHGKHTLNGAISYEAIDAIHIPYEAHFDVIVLKSIIGGVSHSGQDALQQKLIDECYKALKPGGRLMYAENLKASQFHQFLRSKFVNWGDRWNYLKFENVPTLFSKYSVHSYQTRGFFATFGRSEGQRKMLAKMDGVCQPLIPKNMRYLVYGVAQK